MMITGRELIDVLERVAVLEWYRYPKCEPSVSNSTSVAVVWRFDHHRTSNEQIVLIVNAIRSVLGVASNTEWDLKFTGRNWVLAPILLITLEESGQFRTDDDVRNYIAKRVPDFFGKARVDLLAIAAATATAFNVDVPSNRPKHHS